MTYCISDIHGEIDRFRAMLKIIQLAPEDQLYILGDVIDRGSAGIWLRHRSASSQPPRAWNLNTPACGCA